MHKITNVTRVLVGALFIVSGLIKANDPMGFSYKLEEYFAPDALNWTIFEGTEVGLSIIICIAEVVLGIAIIAGEQFILATWSLLLMIVFFTFLTGYTAIGNWFVENYDTARAAWWENLFGFKSREQFRLFKDCGCFGDALKLTPWQSFLKDVVLLVLIVWMFIKRKTVKPNGHIKTDFQFLLPAILLIALFSFGVIRWSGPIWFSVVAFAAVWGLKKWRKESKSRAWWMAGAATIVTLVFTLYSYTYLPVRDYRPYAEGNNIQELMTVPKDAPTDSFASYAYCLNKKTNEYEEFLVSTYPWDDTVNYTCDSFTTKKVREGYEPPIHDFKFYDKNDSDVTPQLLGYEGYQVLVVMHNLSKTQDGKTEALEELQAGLKNAGFPVYFATSSGKSQQQTYSPKLDFVTGDGTMLKTIIRSNPGIVLLKGPKVVKKWSANRMPDLEAIQQETTK